jgi:hypothetical protein
LAVSLEHVFAESVERRSECRRAKQTISGSLGDGISRINGVPYVHQAIALHIDMRVQCDRPPKTQQIVQGLGVVGKDGIQ